MLRRAPRRANRFGLRFELSSLTEYLYLLTRTLELVWEMPGKRVLSFTFRPKESILVCPLRTCDMTGESLIIPSVAAAVMFPKFQGGRCVLLSQLFDESVKASHDISIYYVSPSVLLSIATRTGCARSSMTILHHPPVRKLSGSRCWNIFILGSV